MKRIYTFNLPKEENVEVEVSSTNEKGEVVKTLKKELKTVDKKYFIKRPNRILNDDARLYFGVQLANFIKAGILTVAQLNKRYTNDGGVLSEPEKKGYIDLYNKLFEKQEAFDKIIVIPEGDKKEEDKKNMEKLSLEILDLQREIRRTEDEKAELFNNTAEGMARNRVLLWWTLNLSYEEDDKGNEKPFFGEGTIEEKLIRLDSFDEEDNEYVKKVINRFSYLISFWFVTGSEDAKDYDKYLNLEKA